MKIGYVTPMDPLNPKIWSGTPFHLYRHLTDLKGLEIIPIIPIPNGSCIWQKISVKVGYLFSGNKQYLWETNTTVLKNLALQIDQSLIGTSVDVIFCPGTVPACPLSYVENKKTAVFWTDAPFSAMVDYYPYYSNLSQRTLSEAFNAERKILDKVKLAIYSSDWAAEKAISFYGLSKEKVKVIPFGANFDSELSLSEVQQEIDNRSREILQILFIGKEWERKGGETVLRVALELKDRNIPHEIIMVGGDREITGHNSVKSFGPLDVQNETERDVLRNLFRKSHFFFMPSVAEAFGVAFCEAASFGLPGVGTNIGGIPSIIKNGQNGYLFPLASSVDKYCDYFVETFSNWEEYRRLAVASFVNFEKKLNWKSSINLLRMELENLC